MPKLKPKKEASGRMTKALREMLDAAPPAAAKRAAEVAISGMADQEWGTAYGRLRLDDKLTAIQFEAARRWDALSAVYVQAIQAPAPNPRAAVLEREPSGAPRDPDSDEGQAEARRHASTIAARNGAREELQAAGRAFYEAVRNVCERGEEVEGDIALYRLRRGLDVLIAFWKIAPEKASAQSERVSA